MEKCVEPRNFNEKEIRYIFANFNSLMHFFVSGLGSILFALTIDSPEINAPISSAIPLALTSEKIKPETTPDIQPVMATNKPAACGE